LSILIEIAHVTTNVNRYNTLNIIYISPFLVLNYLRNTDGLFEIFFIYLNNGGLIVSIVIVIYGSPNVLVP